MAKKAIADFVRGTASSCALFSAGFAFGSPAHSSIIAEMVSAEDLASAYTLAGKQMDLSKQPMPSCALRNLPKACATTVD